VLRPTVTEAPFAVDRAKSPGGMVVWYRDENVCIGQNVPAGGLKVEGLIQPAILALGPTFFL